MTKTTVIIGVGPGLGMSMARRFGAEGHRIVLISRNAERHAGYIADLESRGVLVEAHALDVTDHRRLREVLTGLRDVDFVYYGPGSTLTPVPVTDMDVTQARDALEWVYSAVAAVAAVLPALTARPGSGLLIAGGLSSVRPMPELGQHSLAAAALRNYALSLHAALADKDVYAGTLTIGGLVERGDIHQMVSADPQTYGLTEGHTLNPDALADTAWEMFIVRDRAEAVFDPVSPHNQQL